MSIFRTKITGYKRLTSGMPATYTKRMERVLIEIAEDPAASRTEKLEAVRRLAELKQVRPPKRKPSRTPQTALLGR